VRESAGGDGRAERLDGGGVSEELVEITGQSWGIGHRRIAVPIIAGAEPLAVRCSEIGWTAINIDMVKPGDP
jgi:hypothetical protein